MTRSRSIRSTHRSASAVFTAIVVVNIVSAVLGGPDWVGYLGIPPLLVMLATGIHLFALPYRRRPSLAGPSSG